MNQTTLLELAPLLVGGLGAIFGLLSTLLSILTRRKLRNADAAEKVASGAEKISDSALDQLDYFVRSNAQLRQQKSQLESALAQAREDYVNAMAIIARMESEYKLAMANLRADHEAVLQDVATLREEYAKLVEENRELIARNIELEDELRRVRAGNR